jgi:hypothetical protein
MHEQEITMHKQEAQRIDPSATNRSRHSCTQGG